MCIGIGMDCYYRSTETFDCLGWSRGLIMMMSIMSLSTTTAIAKVFTASRGLAHKVIWLIWIFLEHLHR